MRHALRGALLVLILAGPAAALPLTTCESCVGYLVADAINLALRVYPAPALFPTDEGVGRFAVSFSGPLGELLQPPGPATFALLTLEQFVAQRWPDLCLVFGLPAAPATMTATAAAVPVTVPEGGSTLALLGAVFTGFALWRDRVRVTLRRAWCRVMHNDDGSTNVTGMVVCRTCGEWWDVTVSVQQQGGDHAHDRVVAASGGGRRDR